MKKLLLAAALLCAPSLAWGQGLPANTEIAGCVASATAPTFVQGYYGQLSCDLAGNLRTVGGTGGGGSANAATTSNATDGQATSTTNQQNVTYNYLYNGTTWDRARGLAGAAFVNNNVFDGTTYRPLLSTTTGVLEPPTAAAGKITRTSTALTASTSTTIAAANANRISFGIQCATGGVSVDETGGTLTAAAVGNGTLFIPAGTAPYFTPPIATRTAVTAYTATAQTCVVTEYLR